MAASLLSTQFVSPQSDFFRQVPQPPPSPPMEDSRCSLPSISKLLGMVDAGTPTTEASPAPQMETRAEVAGSTSHQVRQDTPFSSTDSRPDTGYGKPWPQKGMPPTPPMGTDAAFDAYSSPMNKSVSILSGAQGRFYETTPPLETDFRRHSLMGPSTTPMAGPPVRQQSYSPSPFPAQPPVGSYFQSPLQAAPTPHPQISNLFYQQPLPQSFPPLSVPVMVAPSSGANPWQHHHYLTPSHGVGYPQSQDRYICQTCNKAFSRPSSLRIHSHSHTGEKPFKCPHAGCGKAFSVRSNMKRHERGCHSFDSGSARASH
ncbi:hypothetical protein HIM_05434 [Hirsutella minnesotensis 3608]|uniref:C2H2-type domain-containing protein n=1 Tax=Hirsutella minnesotensis 3608 TaxID=1043627 RepID=A0A0F7ZPC1_9HYPO|nr:hypothetical protein HIM_05434 [Hirsutella minnesotensis 3608]